MLLWVECWDVILKKMIYHNLPCRVGKTIQFLKGTVPCAQQSPILTVSSNKDMETDTAAERYNTVPLPLNATKLNCWSEGAHDACLMVLWWWGFFMGFAFNRGLQKGTRVAYTNWVQWCPTITSVHSSHLLPFRVSMNWELHKMLSFLSDSPYLVLYWGREPK